MTEFPALLPARHLFVNRLIWAVILAVLAVDVALIFALDFMVIPHKAADGPMIMLLCAGLALYSAYIKRNDSYFLMGNLVNQAVLGGLAMMSWNYLSQTLARPFIDDHLIAFDRALGFDWRAFVAGVDAIPSLATALSIAYQTFAFMPMVMLFLLFIEREFGYAQRIILSFLFTALATTILAALFPAVTGYWYYGLDASAHPAVNHVYEQTLMSLRDGSLKTIAYPPVGLIAFPSFHATMAVILMYASWPLKRLRWFIIPLNLLMLVSCITDGGHWLADVIGGVALALAGLLLAEKILPRGLDHAPAAA